MQKYSADINIMIKAAYKAAKGLVRDFGEVENLQVSRKGPKDFVTASDIKAEQIIYDDLSYARPDYSFIMEERGSVDVKDSEFRWVIDPLDGTINFLHGISSFCISIALEKRISKTRREIQAAVILSPIHKELFWAEKGQGAWLESTENRPITRLRVANRNKLNDTLLCVGSPKRDMAGTEEIMARIENTNISDIKNFMETTLVNSNPTIVAIGKLDYIKKYDELAGLFR